MSSDRSARVSVRELYEITKWAFIAAGASAGEASAAARVVRLAEVQHGCGIEAAVDELAHHTFTSAAVDRHRGSIEVIDDAHGRGLLMLGSLVAALVAVRGQSGPPMLIRGLSLRPVMAAVLVDGLRCAPSGHMALCAWDVAPDGSLVHGVHAAHDPYVTHYGKLEHLAPREWSGQAGPGVLVASAPVPDGMTMGATDRLTRALRYGLEVDAATWCRLSSSAQHYLVEEQ